jgi:hypothetical protein
VTFDENAIVRDIMARAAPPPEDLTPYDWELLEFEKVMASLQSKQGQTNDLENFRKEIIGRFAEVNWVVEVQVFETDQEGLYAWDVNLVGRITPVSKTGESDFDRRRYDVVNDTLEIAPDLKGHTIPFSEALVHNTALAQPNN